jgi:hypothetical protein
MVYNIFNINYKTLLLLHHIRMVNETFMFLIVTHSSMIMNVPSDKKNKYNR